METIDDLSIAAYELEQAARLVDHAHKLVSPIPKGVPSSGLRAAIDRARDALHGAASIAGDELRYLERLGQVRQDPALDDVDQATSFGPGRGSGIPQA